MGSRELQNLCCITQVTLFNVCLSEDDLRDLEVWHDHPNRSGFSPSVWCRALLHKACQGDPASARRVTDRLDLRYLDTLVLVREMDLDELERTVALWLARPEGAALPGLLWSLCTDPRPEGHALGNRLCHEAVVLACGALVAGGCESNASSSSANKD
ncbi:MAG: hypothetical protein ACI8X5_000834 [Planctomycetota bacterium]|jgi:hypothetical protein